MGFANVRAGTQVLMLVLVLVQAADVGVCQARLAHTANPVARGSLSLSSTVQNIECTQYHALSVERPGLGAVALVRVLVIQKGTRVLISLWDSLMFGRVPKNAPAGGLRDGVLRRGGGGGLARHQRARR